jgi:AcrR family transcriptional regulator
MEVQMDNPKMDTQSKIISTAIDLLGRQVNLNFTIREIAEKANVNLASVNYYFRSKDNLISEVEQHFVNEMSLIYEELHKSGVKPENSIKNWAEKTMEHLIEYPGILFMMVTTLITDVNKKASIVKLIDFSEYHLTPTIKKLTGINDETEISFKVMQLMAGVIMPVLLYHGAGRTFKIDINDGHIRTNYIDSLIKSIL